MNVTLKFFAGLRAYLPDGDGPHTVDLADGATVAEVFQRYGIPAEKPRIILVNGRHAGLDHVLTDGDLLSVFPPVAGG